MAHVELLGPPGSGKSTIARALIGSWPGALGLEQATHRAVREHGIDPVTRAASRVAGPDSRIWKVAYGRSRDRSAALDRFTRDHPDLIQAIERAQRERVERDRGQELVRGWVHGLCVRYQLATEADIERLVIDEGFAQRAVAIFGYGFGPADEPNLASYLAAIPVPRTVLLVDTPIEKCAQRLDARGWSERVRDLSSDQRLRCLEASTQVVTEVASALERRGVDLVRVDGSASADQSVRIARATLPD